MGDSKKAHTWTFEGVGEFPDLVGMEGILEQMKKHQPRCECGEVRDLFMQEVDKFRMKSSYKGKSE